MPHFEVLRTDLTAVVKGFRASRSVLAVAVLTLASGIGLNGAMLGLVDRALLSAPLYIGHPEELFTVSFERTFDGRTLRMSTTSYPTFRTMRDDLPALKGAAAWQPGPSALVLDREQIDARTMLVSAGYFDLIQASPQLGRAAFTAGSADAVISYEFWMAAFRGDPHVLGRRLAVNGIEFQVGGVMPRGFSGHAAQAIDAWFPIEEVLRSTPDWDSPFRNMVSILTRVAPADLAAASTQAAAALGGTVVLAPAVGAGIGEQERRIAFWLVGVSVLVLLIGLANAGTLLLVRAARRRREAAIRAALGAGRGRLLRQLAGESLLIALAATAVSLLLGRWLDESVRRALLPGVIERIGFDPLSLMASIAAGTAAALIALAAGAAHLPSHRGDDLKRAGKTGLALQKGLLVVQAGLSVLLLAGAGMFGRSLHGLMHQDFGFTTEGVLLVDFEQGPGSFAGRRELLMDALQRIYALPGVASATVYQSMPFGNFHVPPIAIPGHAETPTVDGQLPYLIGATPEFLDILGIRIVEGRAFTAADERGAPVVIVNQTMAKTAWPGKSAVGQCIRIGFDPDFDPSTAVGPPTPSAAVPCRQVIGVARDVRQRSVVPDGNEARFMQYYVPFAQIPPPPFGPAEPPQISGLLVKATASDPALNHSLRQALTLARADLPPARVRTYASLLERQVRPWQLGVTLLTLFSALAVLLAAVGLYASFAHTVVLRRREMAIRIAIGATPRAVRSLIFRDALMLTLAAAIVGCFAAVLAGRSLQSLLYGIVAADPIVLGGAAALMAGVAIAATLLPALSAARANPGELLKAE